MVVHRHPLGCSGSVQGPRKATRFVSRRLWLACWGLRVLEGSLQQRGGGGLNASAGTRFKRQPLGDVSTTVSISQSVFVRKIPREAQPTQCKPQDPIHVPPLELKAPPTISGQPNHL